MLEGTRLGPLIFHVLINDLCTILPTYKYVDDATLSEVIARSEVSGMRDTLNQLTIWVKHNKMNINMRKTKEIILGLMAKNPPEQLSFNNQLVEQVNVYKLLGLYLNDKLSWHDHVRPICFNPLDAK